MKPKVTPASAQPDFFQVELASIISLRHPLVRLLPAMKYDNYIELVPNFSLKA